MFYIESIFVWFKTIFNFFFNIRIYDVELGKIFMSLIILSALYHFYKVLTGKSD